MNNIRELYQEVILDHNRNPRNYGKLAEYTHFAKGFNPLCGDKQELYLQINDHIIQQIGFESSGCAISTASASLMSEMLLGKTITEAEILFSQIQELLTKENIAPQLALGKMKVLAGVREFPARVKCATLAWHTLKSALQQSTQPVSTE